MLTLKNPKHLTNHILKTIDDITTPGSWKQPVKGEAISTDICNHLKNQKNIKIAIKLTPKRLSYILKDSNQFEQIKRIDPRNKRYCTFWRRKQ